MEKFINEKKKREEGKQGKINPYTGDKNKQKLREGKKGCQIPSPAK